jgi:hypothetical protein
MQPVEILKIGSRPEKRQAYLRKRQEDFIVIGQIKEVVAKY